jgi:hypothetical protein
VDKKTPRARAFSPMCCHGAARLVLTAPRSYEAVALHRGACEKRLRDGKLATSSECHITKRGPASKIPDKRHIVRVESTGLKHLRGHDAREGSRCLHMVIPAVVKPVNGSRRVRSRARRPQTLVFSLVSFYTYCISSNNFAIVLLYQWLPTSIQCGEAMARRRK